ncbi:arylesterase [Ciceribacter sp. L1K23]|uniref:arylesterase n=1 Tax=unclassified Ciceribacter TaxID=2628820 RepID=UPI001ABDA034|nr:MULTISPECIES: arylesterase [unclassified Ciceribacter]MBO3762512.1 arylesterase [Ciceribacter sp. L1K22]MBR0554131.1 arylesterase [Ciceribacter sp. L1K23]
MAFKASALQIGVIAFCLLSGLLPAKSQDRVVKLVGLGDSLMAGYQLSPDESLTAQLQKSLREKGLNVEIANAAVSGDTTSGGLSRVDWSVPDGTDGVILELGANDALRGLSPAETKANLTAIIERLQERGMSVFLVGMLAPPNMGSQYGEAFNAIYPELASTFGLPLYPFVLDGVVTKPELQLEDGMHPNADGVAVMTQRMMPLVETFVGEILEKAK